MAKGKRQGKREQRELFSFHITAGLGWSWLQLCWWSPALHALLRLPQYLRVPGMRSQAKREADGLNAAPPPPCGRHNLRRRSFLSITDILLEGSRLPVSFGSEEGMAKHSNSSQPQFQGNAFKMWSVPLICSHRGFSVRSNPISHWI